MSAKDKDKSSTSTSTTGTDKGKPECITKNRSYFDLASAKFHTDNSYSLKCEQCKKEIKCSNISALNLLTHYQKCHPAKHPEMLEIQEQGRSNGRNAQLKLRRQPTAKKLHHVTSGDSRGRRLTTWCSFKRLAVAVSISAVHSVHWDGNR